MKKLGTILLIIALATLTATSINAATLAKRHQVEFKFGWWQQTTDSLSEFNNNRVISVENSGLAGGLGYGYWLQENAALTFDAGVFRTKVSDFEYAPPSSSIAWVESFLIGLKYYFLKSSTTSSLRPFVKPSLGVFVGCQRLSGNLDTRRTEGVLGGRIGAGIDFLISRRFTTGLDFGYNLMTDFDKPIGGSRNYSGPEYSFSLGILFGKGAR